MIFTVTFKAISEKLADFATGFDVARNLGNRRMKVRGDAHAWHQHQRHTAVEHDLSTANVLPEVELPCIRPFERVPPARQQQYDR